MSTAIQVTGTEVVERGGPIQLVCNATGRPDPPHNVEWYKENRLIESDAHGGIMITKKIETRLLVSVLAIRRSKMSDSGEYHCRSSGLDVGRIHVNILNGNNVSVKAARLLAQIIAVGGSQNAVDIIQLCYII